MDTSTSGAWRIKQVTIPDDVSPSLLGSYRFAESLKNGIISVGLLWFLIFVIDVVLNDGYLGYWIYQNFDREMTVEFEGVLLGVVAPILVIAALASAVFELGIEREKKRALSAVIPGTRIALSDLRVTYSQMLLEVQRGPIVAWFDKASAGLAVAVVTAIVVGYGYLVITEDLKLRNIVPIIAISGLPFLFLYYIVRRLLLRFDTVAVRSYLSAHSRYILFLRSFLDDRAVGRATVDQTGYWAAFSWLLGSAKSWEDVVMTPMKRLGAIVAIGSPRDKIAPDIANLIYVEKGEEWQSVVRGLIARADSIVVNLGTTEWVAWELQQICDANSVGPLLLLLPPSKPADRGRRWQLCLRGLEQSPIIDQLRAIDTTDLLGVGICRGELMLVMKGSTNRAQSYQDACALFAEVASSGLA